MQHPRRLLSPDTASGGATGCPRAGPSPNAPEDLDDGMRPELHEERLPAAKQPAQSPLHRLRLHRPHWLAKMKVMGTICALTLSILATGYRLDWSMETGPAPPIFQPSHPSASVHREFTGELQQ